MTRPDCALSPLSAIFDALFDRLDAIDARLAGRDGIILTPAAVARALGLGRDYFVSKPWRIPSFGAGVRRYTLAEYREWLERPEAARRSEWDAKPERERRMLRGAA
jgi:hypothetical protein